jgi:predicted AAA+ superfamily ATPase
MEFPRKQLFKNRNKHSCVLWGPRQTGKSTLLRQLFSDAIKYDLLLSDEYYRLSKQPSLMREEILAQRKKNLPVVIDEIQKIPALLDEVHWLIENHKIQFILSGSSPRKVVRSGANMLGGRILRYELFPLVFAEIPNFNLNRALNHGLLPPHYLAKNPRQMLLAYIGDYLKEEIANEAITRNIPLFSRFLETAAFSNGEIVNFTNIARECGVSVPTVKEYFQILIDTLLGRFVPSFQRKPKRRVILAPKFYYFDVGITNALLNRKEILPRSELFGKAFEHFIFQELIAHSHYSSLNYPVTYWRTASQIEVDFILGNNEMAVEVKGTSQVQPMHLNGLKAFMEEYKVRNAIVVSLDASPRTIGKITVLPWKIFLEKLWGGELMKG